MSDFILFLIYFIIIALALFFVNKFLKRFKFPKVGSIAVFTGGLKTGKSAVSLALALKEYKRAVFNWKLSCFFTKFFNFFRKKNNKQALPEKPLLYSSIKLKNIDFVLLTTDLILRKKRFAYKSVVFIDEASLLADSQLIKDKKVNKQLLLFFKLFGHETRGGKCIINSHCLSDLHYSLKRVVSQYFYIHHTSRYIPFFAVSLMREERFSEDNSTMNVFTEDVENTLRSVLISKSVFKKYDLFCYSALTDDLPIYNETLFFDKRYQLKMSDIVSFREDFRNIKGELDDE